MDLNNNLMGREYANDNPNLDYNQLWMKAMSDNALITSLDEAQDKLVLTDDQIFINVNKTENGGISETKFVRVFVPNDSKQQTHIMNKNEYFKISEGN